MPRKARPLTIAEKIDALSADFTAFTKGENGTPGAYERFRDIERQFVTVRAEIENNWVAHNTIPIHTPQAYETLLKVGDYVDSENAKDQKRKGRRRSVLKWVGQGVLAVLGSGSVGWAIGVVTGVIK